MNSITLLESPTDADVSGPDREDEVYSVAEVNPPARQGSTTSQGRKAAGASAERKLALLRRIGLFGADTMGATIERASTLDDLRQAYRLVHDIYLGTGFIEPEPSGIRLRIFETTSETATFVAKVEGRVVGVLSVVCDSVELGLPADQAFRRELDDLRHAGQKLCEVTNQAVASEYRQSAIPTELMRCAIATALARGCDQAIAAVSPSHLGFYELIGFCGIASERSYSDKIADPVIGVGLPVERYRERQADLSATETFIHDFLAVTNPFLSLVATWADNARRQFLNPEFLEQLFVIERNVLAECSPMQLRVLYRRWGQEMFAAVTRNPFFATDDNYRPSSLPVELPRAFHAVDDAVKAVSVTNPSKRISVRSPNSSRRQTSHTVRT